MLRRHITTHIYIHTSLHNQLIFSNQLMIDVFGLWEEGGAPHHPFLSEILSKKEPINFLNHFKYNSIT